MPAEAPVITAVLGIEKGPSPEEERPLVYEQCRRSLEHNLRANLQAARIIDDARHTAEIGRIVDVRSTSAEAGAIEDVECFTAQLGMYSRTLSLRSGPLTVIKDSQRALCLTIRSTSRDLPSLHRHT